MLLRGGGSAVAALARALAAGAHTRAVWGACAKGICSDVPVSAEGGPACRPAAVDR